MAEIEVPSQGPRNARVMVVGEAPGEKEVEHLVPFVGYSGIELTRMLGEAGFERRDCYVTNVCKVRPPGNDIEAFFGTKTSGLPAVMGRYLRPELVSGLRVLEEDIRTVNPDLILAFGDTALWACTGLSGITKWRGSVLECRELGQPGPQNGRPKVIPTYHPAAILRSWDWRWIAVEDLRRAKRELDTHGREIKLPPYQFEIRPSFEAVLRRLSELRALADRGPLWLSVDIETQRRHIDCIGLAWSKTEALCIPFIQCDGGTRPYWPTALEEGTIVWALKELLTHPNCHVIGQNWPYDQQYIARRWGFIANLKWDTMTIHHSIFCLLPKSLSFQSSIYCDFHRYWKEDADDEDGKRLNDDAQWTYNCRDVVVTYEIRDNQEKIVEQLKFPRKAGETPQERQMSMHWPVLKAMLRGVRSNSVRKMEVLNDVDKSIKDREAWLEKAVGHPLNPRSPQKLQDFFYHDMAVRPVISRKTKKPTCDEEALQTLAKRDPILAPLCNVINDIRSLGTHRAVCSVPLDYDGRFRCSYAIPGTDTLRFNSKADAFGFGTNLQNITSGTEDIDPEHLEDAIRKGILLKPNLRKLFVPDPGYTLVEFDLPQADAQIVAWEAGDEKLKAIFRDPTRDLHTENAIDIFGSCSGKSDPKRQYAKIGVHAVNYLATARTLAAALGISVAQAEMFILRWFTKHPEIPAWQNRILTEITTRRYVENAFGYRRYSFDRPENDHKHALAWQPQSTVALITNTGIRRVDADLCTKGVDFLLQVHDSAVFQVWTKDGPDLVKAIRDRMVVEVPYDDPLRMIPDMKASEVSWGDCKKRPEWLEGTTINVPLSITQKEGQEVR